MFSTLNRVRFDWAHNVGHLKWSHHGIFHEINVRNLKLATITTRVLLHIIIVSNSQYLPMNMVLSTKARDASSAARAKATDLAPNISLYFLFLCSIWLFLLSFVFSTPQLNFLIRCLSSLFAHSQHPPALHSSPFSLLPHFPKASKLSFLIKSLFFFLKLGIVVWLLILFTNIKQKMHIMGNSIKLNLT